MVEEAIGGGVGGCDDGVGGGVGAYGGPVGWGVCVDVRACVRVIVRVRLCQRRDVCGVWVCARGAALCPRFLMKIVRRTTEGCRMRSGSGRAACRASVRGLSM